MSEQSDLFTAAGFREHQDGHGPRHALVGEHTGLTRDERLSHTLQIMADAYDPTRLPPEAREEMPGRFEDTQMYENIVGAEATETARRAMEKGDMATLKHMTGDTGQRADVSGHKAMKTLEDFMSGPAPMFYEWAEPGTGKTAFALYLGQLWKWEHPDGLVASNIRTLKQTDDWSPAGDVDSEEGVVRDPDTGDVLEEEPRDGWLATFGELEEWMQQDGEPSQGNTQTPKLFIFDEASSNAGGGGSDGYNAKQKMGPMLYKIRKYGGSIIVIGHDGKDVHPMIREMGVCVHKDDLKQATFYEDVKNRKGVGEIETIEGIPMTDWDYYDKEATTWSWAGGEDDDVDLDEERKAWDMATIVVSRENFEEPIAFSRLGEITQWDGSTCNRRYRKYTNEGKYSDLVQRGLELIA